MTDNGELLIFGQGNAKLDKDTLTFSLPAGFSCPGALECLSKADPSSGVLKDGPQQKFRCFSASTESAFTSVRDARWHNYNLLRYAENSVAISTLIQRSVHAARRSYTTKVRVHVAGDFFSSDYFRGWMSAAAKIKGLTFYAYTKSLHLWVKHQTSIPQNFRLVASIGGKYDDLVESHRLVSARVVMHPDDAKALGLEIDHDDSLALGAKESFALLLHGCQPKGSEASQATKRMRDESVEYSYSK